METLQILFLLGGIFVLWGSMSLNAPAPVTPNDVTSELNSTLEIIEKLRSRSTPKAASDRAKQKELDKIFDAAEEEIRSLLKSIEAKGDIMKTRTDTDAIEYEQGWVQLNEGLEKVIDHFKKNIAGLNESFTFMKSIHGRINQHQREAIQSIDGIEVQIEETNNNLRKVLSMYQ